MHPGTSTQRSDRTSPMSQQPNAAKFRLPKLGTPRCQQFQEAAAGTSAPAADMVYTRYGFYETARSASSSSLHEVDSGPSLPTSRTVFPGPSFTYAVVTPVWSPAMLGQGATQICDNSETPALGVFPHPGGSDRSHPKRSQTALYAVPSKFSAFGSSLSRSPTVHGGWQAIQRLQQQQQQQQSQVSSDTGSSFDTGHKPVEWVMKPQRRFQSDRKGQQRNQGPFSRELQVHAKAPQAWLRMKWGGSHRPQV